VEFIKHLNPIAWFDTSNFFRDNFINKKNDQNKESKNYMDDEFITNNFMVDDWIRQVYQIVYQVIK